MFKTAHSFRVAAGADLGALIRFAATKNACDRMISPIQSLLGHIRGSSRNHKLNSNRFTARTPVLIFLCPSRFSASRAIDDVSTSLDSAHLADSSVAAEVRLASLHKAGPLHGVNPACVWGRTLAPSTGTTCIRSCKEVAIALLSFVPVLVIEFITMNSAAARYFVSK